MRSFVGWFAWAAVFKASASEVDFEVHGGAIPDDDTSATWWTNGQALNATLRALQPGDTLIIPNKTYHLMGGIRADDVTGVTIRIEGTLAFAANMDEWPRTGSMGGDGLHRVMECFLGKRWKNVIFTSSGTGTLDGNGATWWGLAGVGYLLHGENRPRMMKLEDSSDILYENVFFKNSPYWTFTMDSIDGLEVRYCTIDARRTDNDRHGIIDLTAFNTDGFDVTGRNVWIHDSEIWNQDDCIAVKDGNPSENMLFERIKASGLGLTIGSIGSGSHIRNITFRDVYMHKTYKGIYMKFRSGPALVEDVTFENIVMDEPEQYAIWIGPAQQSDSANLCAAHPCSICWPETPLSVCNVPPATYKDITLRNITVNSPAKSPGLIFANSTTPMQNIIFEDVKFTNPQTSPFSDYYYCKNVQGIAKGSTWPIPPCFEDQTGTCVNDGSCTEAGRTCCSGGQHSTLNCGSKARCGCTAAGACAATLASCCSGVGHKTLYCDAGVGYRCDSGETNSSLVV